MTRSSYRLNQIIQTTVTYQRNSTEHMKSKIVDIMLMCHSQLDRKVSIMYVGTLHVYEKLLSEVILKFLSPFGDSFQWKAKF